MNFDAVSAAHSDFILNRGEIHVSALTVRTRFSNSTRCELLEI